MSAKLKAFHQRVESEEKALDPEKHLASEAITGEVGLRNTGTINERALSDGRTESVISINRSIN